MCFEPFAGLTKLRSIPFSCLFLQTTPEQFFPMRQFLAFLVTFAVPILLLLRQCHHRERE
jgi:hypothetical protein